MLTTYIVSKWFEHPFYRQPPTIVSAWVLIPPLANYKPATLLQNLISPLERIKSLDDSNILRMFHNNTYTDFWTAYNHV